MSAALPINLVHNRGHLVCRMRDFCITLKSFFPKAGNSIFKLVSWSWDQRCSKKRLTLSRYNSTYLHGEPFFIRTFYSVRTGWSHDPRDLSNCSILYIILRIYKTDGIPILAISCRTTYKCSCAILRYLEIEEFRENWRTKNQANLLIEKKLFRPR